MAKTKVNISLDDEIAKQLKDIATAQHMTVSALITMWVLSNRKESNNDENN